MSRLGFSHRYGGRASKICFVKKGFDKDFRKRFENMIDYGSGKVM